MLTIIEPPPKNGTHMLGTADLGFIFFISKIYVQVFFKRGSSFLFFFEKKIRGNWLKKSKT